MHHLRSVLLRVIAPCLALVLLLGGLSEIAVRAESDPTRGDVVAVVEHLRLQVPRESREQWMAAERGSWEPWLKQQPGFLGRDLFWDPATEEGTLLIRWSSRKAWKSISMAQQALSTLMMPIATSSLHPENPSPVPIRQNMR